MPPDFDPNALSGVAVFGFRFVVVSSDELEIIGSSLKQVDQTGQLAPVGAIVTRGTAKRQQVGVPAQ